MQRIVVFESDKWLADLLVEHFTNAGYEPTWFEFPPTDTVAAVAKLNPILVTMDIVMRDMDGFQATYLLKQDDRTKNIPLVFYSNLRSPENIERGLALGAVRYVVKATTPPEQFVRESLSLITPPQ